jgi:hypothetical protein
VLQALRLGEVSIHKAVTWLRKPGKQVDALGMHQNRRGIMMTVNTLLRAHQEARASEQLDAQRVATTLAKLGEAKSGSILVAEIRVPGTILLLSTALFQALTSQGELNV